MTRVLVDLDTGIDDSLALLWLLASPGVELVAAVASAGNVEADQVTRNTQAWLDLAGRADVEVCQGAAAPVASALQTTPETHGPHGVGRARLPEPSRGPSTRSGARAWVDLAGSCDVAVVLGPCTNLALALRADPGLAARLRRVVIMGGVFGQRGNTTPVAEWNTWVDPEALAEVLAAFAALDGPARVDLCPLDATETIALRPPVLDRLRARAGGADAHPIMAHLEDAFAFYFDFHEAEGHERLAHTHDPYVVACALDPDEGEWLSVCVDVETTGRLTRAQTIADWRGLWGRAANARVLVGTDPDGFFAETVERVGGWLAALSPAGPGAAPRP